MSEATTGQVVHATASSGLSLGGSAAARVKVTLGMPEADLEALREIAGGDDLAGAFAKAVALYRASVQAIREGKHVGIADDADKLETEFVGL